MVDESGIIQRAAILIGQERYADAERELRRALAGNPNFALAHALLSLCLSSQDRHDEAIAEGGQAIQIDPNL